MDEQLIALIDTQLTKKRKKLQSLRQVAAQIPMLERDIEALMRTLSILSGKDEAQINAQVSISGPIQSRLLPSGIQSQSRLLVKRRISSIPSIAYEILREVKKPLTRDELVAYFELRGRRVDRDILGGALYRDAQQGDRFIVVSPGTFGLLEWKDKPEEDK